MSSPPVLFHDVACPFCGMICDDLEVERAADGLKVRRSGCGRAASAFERKLPPSSPMIAGKDVPFAEAVAEAARLIGSASQPLYGGLATDVEGMRAVMALAERTGGVVDHAASGAQYRNFKVLQSVGWTMSTLTEVRNRADLVIIAGTDVQALHPRFFERIVAPAESMFGVTPKDRTVVVIGEGLEKAAKAARVGKVVSLACKPTEVGEVVGVLRARLRGFSLDKVKFGGVTLAEIDTVAELCRAAQYGVVVWAPAAFDFPHAELTVDQLAGLVKDLNPTTRFAGLTLGGAEGATTAASVATWQSGYPLRVSYASGAAEFDPARNDIARMLKAGEGDLLVWVASYSPDFVPPRTDLPTIVLGTPGLKPPKGTQVFVPVGTPGVDHAGRLIRVDSVVSLPLKNLGRAALPSVADVVSAIEAAL
ncbi:formylmethanofuran dehydrogenase [Methyloceanibacter methanicus]|uniref:Formylmethanofuran dehydrogenase n=1 Tax=Methyloceanibacter methanicus TaxID=1774968 RepID=A0A1E3W0T6_9HYPH|nr:formylmethanofuran dehydrogenase [Methyloceanibacter methanicus]ODR99390.1 formylmethanofuran dehydrogenase [Methyloceanibacter methanicus]